MRYMSRPNILLLFMDQQRFDTIRALGNWEPDSLLRILNHGRAKREIPGYTDVR